MTLTADDLEALREACELARRLGQEKVPWSPQMGLALLDRLAELEAERTEKQSAFKAAP